MQADYFKRLQAIFDAALEQSTEMRAGFVSQACGEDHAMAEELMALINYEAQSAASKTAQPFTLAAVAFDAAEAKSLIGKTIGRFRLEAEIASGGMGRVFKAKRVDEDLDQTVALKLIRQELFNPALLKRFSAERQILASLNHPGIAHLIDAGTDEQGTPYVAMEYVAGFPLLEYCERNALLIRDRVSLFRQILAAVSYAHRNLVVHRDLKPANVLVTAEGQVKLLDFGIAKALETDHLHTATADHFFTPAYAAPEQLLKQNVAVTCDVYALGAILYTLLTGVPPFDLSSLSAGDIERHILKIPPASMQATALKRGENALRPQGVGNLARWAKQLDGDLENIVQKALRKEPNARYLSAEQFDNDLQRYLEQRPVQASGAGWLYRALKFCERHAAALTIATLVTIASLVGIFRIVEQNVQIRMERDRAQAALSILQNSFRSADPTQLEAGDTRARAILASAAREVAVLEKRQPALFQDLAYQVGEIQLNLGLTSAGLDLVRRANRVVTGSTNTGLLLEIRGLILANKIVEARELIESRRALLDGTPEFFAEEGHLLYLEKRYTEAIPMLERLRGDAELRKSVVLRDRIDLYLAEAYRKSERFEQALALLDGRVQAQIERFGSDHPNVLIAQLRRIELLPEVRKADQAEHALIAIKPALDRYYDQGSAVQGEYHNIFGSLLNRQNRSDEALQQFRQALSSDLIALGPDHENTLRAHLNVAVMIAYSAEDRAEAYPHFLRAIAGIEKTKGAASSLAGFFRLEAAKSYYWDRDMASARRILTPPNALRYFPAMPDVNQKEYLAALYYGFGPQNCKPGWELRAEAGRPARPDIARSLMCRYDPKGEHRPTD
jgi:eukaryotic-like serine/threonine-protein kinase